MLKLSAVVVTADLTGPIYIIVILGRSWSLVEEKMNSLFSLLKLNNDFMFSFQDKDIISPI